MQYLLYTTVSIIFAKDPLLAESAGSSHHNNVQARRCCSLNLLVQSGVGSKPAGHACWSKEDLRDSFVEYHQLVF